MASNRRSVVVKESMWMNLKKVASAEGRSLSELIREAIADLLTKKSKPVSHGYDPVKDRM